MGVKVFLGSEFEHTHEKQIFDELIRRLKQEWDNSSELVVLIGSLYCNGNEIDSLIIRKKSVNIIEFKNYGGKITFKNLENDEWKKDDCVIKSGNRRNPFQQVNDYKKSLLNFFNEHAEEVVRGRKKVINYGHIQGIVVFHEKIDFDFSKLQYPIKSWFHVADIYGIVQLLGQITSSEITLSDAEILKITEILGVKEYQADFAVPEARDNSHGKNQDKNLTVELKPEHGSEVENLKSEKEILASHSIPNRKFNIKTIVIIGCVIFIIAIAVGTLCFTKKPKMKSSKGQDSSEFNWKPVFPD